MAEASILVVEDDPDLGAALLDALGSQGYDVRHAPDGAAALAAADRAAPDLVLLDLGLPDLDGVELCRQLRARVPTVVVVVLTARRDEVDVVVALDAGADDYLTKPFRLRELLARLRAHLRRATAPAPGRALLAGNLRVDTAARRVTSAGVEVALRPREFDLLAALADRLGAVATRDELMSEVWDTHWHSSTKTLDIHVSALRRKLAEAGWDGEVVTLRGVGYRMEAP